jgi:hypothetical protein
MTIKIVQKAYRFGTRHGWVGEFVGAGSVAAFLMVFGIWLLIVGSWGNPKVRPGREQPLSPRALHILVGGFFTPLGVYFGYVAVRTFRERHKLEEHIFTVTGVTSYEVSDSDDESFQSDETKKKRWSTY